MRTTYILLILITLIFTNLKGQCPTTELTLSSQSEVDAFKTIYPSCTDMMYKLIISGNDITNIDSLENISCFEEGFTITDNPILLDINGLGNVNSINRFAQISNNPMLVTLLPLQNATNKQFASIGIENNSSLIDLTGLGSFDFKTDFYIFFNENLQSLNGLSFGSIHTGDISIDGNLNVTDFSQLSSLTEVSSLLIGGGFGPDEILEVNNLSFLSNLTKITLGITLVSLDITNLTGLSNLIEIGSLGLDSNPMLFNFAGFPNLTTIDGGLFIYDNENLIDFSGMESVTNIIENSNNGSVSLEIVRNNNLISTKGLQNLTDGDNNIFINSNPKLADLVLLSNLLTINKLSIFDNSALTNLDDLDQIVSVTQDLRIKNNAQLSDCSAICNLLVSNAVGGTITIEDNPSECSSQTELEMVCFPCQFLGYSTNTWIGPSTANWNDEPGFWSLNVIPTTCHNVIIPSGFNISVIPGNNAICHTIDINSGAELHVPSSANLDVIAPN